MHKCEPHFTNRVGTVITNEFLTIELKINLYKQEAFSDSVMSQVQGNTRSFLVSYRSSIGSDFIPFDCEKWSSWYWPINVDCKPSRDRTQPSRGCLIYTYPRWSVVSHTVCFFSRHHRNRHRDRDSFRNYRAAIDLKNGCTFWEGTFHQSHSVSYCPEFNTCCNSSGQMRRLLHVPSYLNSRMRETGIEAIHTHRVTSFLEPQTQDKDTTILPLI